MYVRSTTLWCIDNIMLKMVLRRILRKCYQVPQFLLWRLFQILVDIDFSGSRQYANHVPKVTEFSAAANDTISREQFFCRTLAFFLGLIAMNGCALFSPTIDPPEVSLISFRSLANTGGPPLFEVVLRVLNPNEQPLEISGIRYSIAVRDREIITGVANDIAPIRGYGEALVTLNAGLELFELLRLLADLGINSAEPLEYRLKAKVDFYGFMPTQRLEKSGEISLHLGKK